MDIKAAREVAARIWCDEEMSGVVMDSGLAEIIALLIQRAAQCPSIGELLGRLSDDEIIRYIFAHNDMKYLMGATLMRMVLTTVRDSNALCDIWLWREGNNGFSDVRQMSTML